MRVLLDTVTFLYAIGFSSRLSDKARSILGDATTIGELSVISYAEIALKNSIGKFTLEKGDIRAGAANLKLRMLPFEEQHSLELFGIPLHHRDPFDRHIIAQALSENIPVLTCDREFRKYRGLKVLW
jgi:PIN domain nuclease of toxin-antitoxin system